MDSQATYHYVVTLQRPVHGGAGMAVRTWTGTLGAVPGSSRREAYLYVWDRITEEDSRWEGANVLHWSLEPDALPHPAVLPPAAARNALPHQRQGE